MSENAELWDWLVGRKLSLGQVVSVHEDTAKVIHGDDEFRILISELLHQEFNAQDKYMNDMSMVFNRGHGDYNP